MLGGRTPARLIGHARRGMCCRSPALPPSRRRCCLARPCRAAPVNGCPAAQLTPGAAALPLPHAFRRPSRIAPHLSPGGLRIRSQDASCARLHVQAWIGATGDLMSGAGRRPTGLGRLLDAATGRSGRRPQARNLGCRPAVVRSASAGSRLAVSRRSSRSRPQDSLRPRSTAVAPARALLISRCDTATGLDEPAALLQLCVSKLAHATLWTKASTFFYTCWSCPAPPLDAVVLAAHHPEAPKQYTTLTARQHISSHDATTS